MNAEEMLKELSEYIAAMTAYYMNVLSEEKIDYKKAHIEGKINVLNGVRKKMKKLEKESCTFIKSQQDKQKYKNEEFIC